MSCHDQKTLCQVLQSRVQQQADLLIILGRDFLEEVRHSLPFRAAKAAGLKELHHILTRSMEHDVTYVCSHNSLKSCRCETYMHNTRSMGHDVTCMCSQDSLKVYKSMEHGTAYMCGQDSLKTYFITNDTHTTQHNTTQHNTTQHNTTQHNTTQHVSFVLTICTLAAYTLTTYRLASCTKNSGTQGIASFADGHRHDSVVLNQILHTQANQGCLTPKS
jgi:hypothetical protein